MNNERRTDIIKQIGLLKNLRGLVVKRVMQQLLDRILDDEEYEYIRYNYVYDIRPYLWQELKLPKKIPCPRCKKMIYPAELKQEHTRYKKYCYRCRKYFEAEKSLVKYVRDVIGSVGTRSCGGYCSVLKKSQCSQGESCHYIKTISIARQMITDEMIEAKSLILILKGKLPVCNPPNRNLRYLNE